MHWTGCHGEERHVGDRDVGGGCNGQGVMSRRDMEVTEVVEDFFRHIYYIISTQHKHVYLYFDKLICKNGRCLMEDFPKKLILFL